MIESVVAEFKCSYFSDSITVLISSLMEPDANILLYNILAIYFLNIFKQILKSVELISIVTIYCIVNIYILKYNNIFLFL